MHTSWWAKNTIAVDMMQCTEFSRCTYPLSDDIEVPDYVEKFPLEARKGYIIKSLYIYGQCMLPDPY